MKHFFIALLILVVSSTCQSWEIETSSTNGAPSYCAKFYSQEKFGGSSFTLGDKEQVADLGDIVGWREGNDTKISLKVRNSCRLEFSEESFFKGELHEFSGNLEEFVFGGTGSLRCTCIKICKCEDIRFHGRECARGYQKDCTDCNALYTPFYREDSTKISSKLAEKITNFVIRPGCNLTVNYALLDNPLKIQTDVFTSQNRVEVYEFEGKLKATSCSCGGNYAETNSRKSSDPPLINIPTLRGKINTELKKPGQENHPGLLAALQSLRMKRSPKNAYILLLGLTGSGKSTAVNVLFDHPNITLVGATQSTTTDIHEFRIPVSVNALGIGNSELRIIDTPGIADTRGITQDSRYLATLDNFLTTHEELKRSIPNLVLVFVKFHENRFYGPGSSFVKMLRTIELFKDKLMDGSFSNVVFVLTHFMSETKEIQRDPSDKIQKFKKVVEEFSTFPKPIVLVVAENKPVESELPSLNGYWQLPNGEFYPRNLFDQLQRTLTSCGDPIGLSVIQSAFSHPDISSLSITNTDHPLLPSTNKKVTKYLSLLSSLELPGESGSEVNRLLDSSFKSLNSTLKSQYPNALNQLKSTLNKLQLKNAQDLPKTTVEILKLFKQVQINPISLYLLDCLNLTMPHFTNLLIGSGYNLKSDRVLKSSHVFEMNGNFQPNLEVGFQLPNVVKAQAMNDLRNVLTIFTSREDYVKNRLASLGLRAEEGSTSGLLGDGTQPGFNIIGDGNDNVKLSAVLEYQKFQMVLNENVSLNEDFLQGLRSLGVFNESSWESVRVWNAFLQTYGTHVVLWASGGGSIEVEVSKIKSVENEEDLEGSTYDEDNEGSKTDELPQTFTLLSETMSNILQYLADNFIGKETPIKIDSGVTYSIKMSGGNPLYFISNVTHHKSTSDTEIWNILDKWQKSLQYQPEMLTTQLKLVPTSLILEKFVEKELRDQFEAAVAAYLNSSLVYVPIAQTAGDFVEDRESSGASSNPVGDFESLQHFATMFSHIAENSRKMQERFMEIMVQSRQETERENARYEQKQRQEREEWKEQERLRREDERFNAEMDFKREQNREARDREYQMFEMEQQTRAKQAQAERDAQMAAVDAQNQQTFMQFLQSENQRQHEAHLAVINKKSWFDKTLDFVGGIFGKTKEDAKEVLPYALMAAGAG